MNWKPIKEFARNEAKTFLLMLAGNDACEDGVIVHARMFEGRWYPIGRDFIIDWDDAIDTATHFCEPEFPSA